jgi:hypothetical protein
MLLFGFGRAVRKPADLSVTGENANRLDPRIIPNIASFVTRSFDRHHALCWIRAPLHEKFFLKTQLVHLFCPTKNIPAVAGGTMPCSPSKRLKLFQCRPLISAPDIRE